MSALSDLTEKNNPLKIGTRTLKMCEKSANVHRKPIISFRKAGEQLV